MNANGDTTPKNEHPKTTKPERNLVFRVSEADFRRFSVGRVKRGEKMAEFLSHLLDLEAKTTIE